MDKITFSFSLLEILTPYYIASVFAWLLIKGKIVINVNNWNM